MAFPFMQLLANSLIIGSIYALVAAGFSLIYITNRFMHFGHGVAVSIAAYATFLFFNMLNFPFWLACILTIIVTVLFGVLVHKLLYVPLRKKKSSTVILLIASVAVLLLFENLILLFFGADIKTIGLLPVTKGLDIFGAIITPLQITIICTTLALLITLHIFMNKTKTGRNLRAVADHPELASIMGINAKRLQTFSFALGSFLAAIAGILVGLEQNLSITMGTDLVVKAFSGAVIGGITSVPGSILGSFILGAAENFGIWFLPSGWKNAITFTLLFIFLLFKPTGLFGIDKGVRK